MFEKLLQIFRVKEVRNKILFVVALLIIFRLVAHIPVPGIDAGNLKKFFEGNQIFGLLDISTGGGLSQLSIVMLGVGPYITASIIMQLLTMVIPRLEEFAKEEGEAGRKKINQYTRYLTVPLAALQSYALINLLTRGEQAVITELNLFGLVTTVVSVVGGTIFLMWIGELITEKGIGNGISLIIFTGIVSRVPETVKEIVVLWDPAKLPTYLIFLAVAVVVIAGVVIITEGQRNIPVIFAKRVRGNKMYGGTSTHLPLRVNQAGVIPIIFALSILLFPGMIANFFVKAESEVIRNIAESIVNWFQNQWVYGILYFGLVIAFTYFYTAVTFDPTNIAENIQKQGGFIPGTRPGNATARYLKRVLNRVTLTGAFFLGFIAVLPLIIRGATQVASLTIGGTALLIVVSVVLETMKQIESQLTMRDYEGF